MLRLETEAGVCPKRCGVVNIGRVSPQGRGFEGTYRGFWKGNFVWKGYIMHNHDNFKSKLVDILNDPKTEDADGADGNTEWKWTLVSAVQNYNFEVSIDREGKIDLVVFNNHEGIEVCSLEAITMERVIEKARALKSQMRY